MKRTTLLLAFGTHGNAELEGDKRFFRNAIIPFLDEHVKKGKGKAAVIYEGFQPTRIEEDESRPEKERVKDNLAFLRRKKKTVMDYLGLMSAGFEETASAILRNIANKGTPPGSYIPKDMEQEITSMLYSSFLGFEEYAMALNRLEPGTVSFFSEPQNAQAIYAETYGKLLQRSLSLEPKNSGIAAKCMALDIEHMMLRDREVKNLAERLAKESPDIAIIIPRGRAHAPMEMLFDKNKYGISLHIGSPDILTFENDAMIRAYGGRLSRRELRLFAKLEEEISAYARMMGFDLDSDKPDNRLLEFAKQTNRSLIQALEKLFLDARAYAIAKNPEIAKELGIRE